MAAASRPVTPSRRYEKKLERRSTVHQPPPLMAARRHAPGARAPVAAGRPASAALPSAMPAAGTKRCGSALPGLAEGLQHVGADLETLRPDARAEPGPTPAAGSQPPPCTARQRRLEHAAGQAAPAGMGGRHGAAVGAASSTGRQSATCTAQATPGSSVQAASATAAARPHRCHPCAGTTQLPCTWRSHTGCAPAPREAAAVLGHRGRVVADGRAPG
jgi:hypothetical protein